MNVQAFREWHEGRLKELAYPEAICDELRDAREKWIASYRTRRTSKGTESR